MIIWLTGMSGSGKTTLGTEILHLIRERIDNIVLIDGDNFRSFFSTDLGYTLEDRKKNLLRIRQLCQFLDSQNIHAICAILSIFPQTEKENRLDFKNYLEIYVEVPFDILVKERDYKGLYQKALMGEIKNVVGVDIPFEAPLNPDLVIRNTTSLEAFLKQATTVVSSLFQDSQGQKNNAKPLITKVGPPGLEPAHQNPPSE